MNENILGSEKKGQVVVITGGGSGIGKSTAVILAKKGYKIVIVGRNQINLESTRKEIEKYGVEILLIKCDINSPDVGPYIVNKTMAKFSSVDILINNAGVPGEGLPLHEVNDNLWDEIINTNLTAAFRIIRAVLPEFMIQKHGNIINIASTAANIAMSNMAAYAASKSGLQALTRAIAFDYASLGIRCNCVSPGATLTNMTNSTFKNLIPDNISNKELSIQRIGKPEQIANVIAFLCSHESSHINGASLIVDAGQGRI